jgi:ubiquinone/menaquinone biosynthesis C-methylase UbiE
MRSTVLANLSQLPDVARALDSYHRLAPTYDATCRRIEVLRLRAVQELALRPGKTVFDVACGTGPVLPALAVEVTPGGKVVGIELSPDMAQQVRRRVEACGVRETVDVVESAVEALPSVSPADALLLCYTHDVLQSPQALERLIDAAKPGARIVILGMRTLPWLWGWPVNLFNLYRARRYLTTYRNMRQPWRLLAERGATLRVVHSALWGSAYIASGTLPRSAKRVADG